MREHNAPKRKKQQETTNNKSSNVDNDNLDEIASVLCELQQLRHQLMQMNTNKHRYTMRFVWCDSAFTRAYEMGDWIVLDNVNCCRYDEMVIVF